MRVDEELELLDDTLRRLKVEYDVYFGGGSKRPPVETEWRVNSLIKKYSDTQKMSSSQRFRYNTIAQRYAVFSDLWRQKLKIREEGYRRPQDAVLAIQGLRTAEEHEAAKALRRPVQLGKVGAKPFRIECSDAEREPEKIRELFDALLDAKRRAGEPAGGAKFEPFLAFLKQRTEQIRREFGCEKVEYRIESEGQKVRLKARAKK